MSYKRETGLNQIAEFNTYLFCKTPSSFIANHLLSIIGQNALLKSKYELNQFNQKNQEQLKDLLLKDRLQVQQR